MEDCKYFYNCPWYFKWFINFNGEIFLCKTAAETVSLVAMLRKGNDITACPCYIYRFEWAERPSYHTPYYAADVESDNEFQHSFLQLSPYWK